MASYHHPSKPIIPPANLLHCYTFYDDTREYTALSLQGYNLFGGFLFSQRRQFFVHFLPALALAAGFMSHSFSKQLIKPVNPNQLIPPEIHSNPNSFKLLLDIL